MLLTTRRKELAINPSDLEPKRVEHEKELRESEDVRILEGALDSAIAHNYEKITRGWFKKRALLQARFSVGSLGIPAKNTLWHLYFYDKNTFWWLMKKYTALGWEVTFAAGSNKEFSFSKKIVDPAKDNSVCPHNSILLEKTRRIAELKAEIAQIEAEIQFLTESPNSRDPLMLPTHDLEET